jgi:hypothetical protein
MGDTGQVYSVTNILVVLVNDGLTQMIMAWYYAGYYTGLFLGGSGSGTQ